MSKGLEALNKILSAVILGNALSGAMVAVGADASPLPESRAPFEQTEDFARRPVSLVSYPFMPQLHVKDRENLLTWAEFVGDVKRDGWRAYVFRQGDHAVAAVWTNERQAELGRKKGRVLKLKGGMRFVDLMGNDRAAPPADADGMIAVPLTPAPLFVVSRDAEGLLKAFEEAR